MLALLTVIWLAFMPLYASTQAEQAFTPVQGATLQAKFDAAAAQAASARQTRYWTAYAFDVRPGVAVDVDFVSEDANFRIQGNWDSSGSGSYFFYDSVGNYPGLETRSLGVFALRDSAGAVERVSVFNLARRHEYAGYPVYWAGRASNEESLNFLRGLAESPRSAYSGRREDVASEAVRALTLHDDRRVPETLQHVARTSTDEDVRAQA